MYTVSASKVALCHQFVGLAPSASGVGQAEALTSTAQGSDCLFYNPASLPLQRPHLSLFGVDANTDRDSVSRVEDYQTGDYAFISEEEFALEEFYHKLNSDKPINLSSTARLLDLVLPYFSLGTFGVLRASSGRISDSYYMNTSVDMGAIGGIGFSIWRFYFGFAKYALLRAGVRSTPSAEQFDVIDNAINDKSFSPSILPFRDFTSIEYGGLNGSNLGFMFQPLPDNLSSVGVAVLNVGSPKFSSKAPIKHKDFDKIEDELILEAQSHSIELERPEELPQMVNVGASLAYGNPEEPVFARIAADFHDMNGSYIDNKLAIATEFGLVLTDQAALASAWPIYSRDSLVYHMGLLGIKGFFSIRPKSYLTYGFGMSFHFGTQMKISILKLDINAFELKTLKENNTVDTTQIHELDLVGFNAKLALTLIF